MEYKEILASAKQDLKYYCKIAGVDTAKEFKAKIRWMESNIPFHDYRNVMNQMMYIKKLKNTYKKLLKVK